MKSKIIGLAFIVSLAMAFAFTAGSPAAPNGKAAPATVAPAEPAAPAAAATPDEHHPEIREAIAALRRAKDHMEHAAHDFGGHRVEALRATDAAIHQLEECLKYDKD